MKGGRGEVVRGGLFNQSLEKGIAVLLAFGPECESMSLSEIAAAAGISKSAAQRFAYTLAELGYLQKHAVTKRYSLTVSTLSLGYRYLLVNRAVERANPFLRDLNRSCGETVNYSEPSGTDMVYVGRFPTNQATPVHMPLGRRLPIYCTAAGRAYLSSIPVQQRYELLESSDLLTYTATTIVDFSELIALCDEAAERGYAYANGEFYEGDLNVAAAVSDSRGNPVGAVSISAPSTRWTLDRVKDELAPLVMATARLISTKQPSATRVEPFAVGTRKAVKT